VLTPDLHKKGQDRRGGRGEKIRKERTKIRKLGAKFTW